MKLAVIALLAIFASGPTFASSAWSDFTSGFSGLNLNLGGHGSKGYGNISLNSGSSHSSHSSHATGVFAPVHSYSTHDLYTVDPYYYSRRHYVVPHTTIVTPHIGHSHHIVVPDRGGYWRRHNHLKHKQYHRGRRGHIYDHGRHRPGHH